MSQRRVLPIVLSFVAMAGYQPQLIAQQYDSDLFNEMHWRMIGPFRGGRTKAAAGIPSQPNVFYMGVVNGGVWKTTDYGRIWRPIFDDQPTGSIGAIAVALSDPTQGRQHPVDHTARSPSRRSRQSLSSHTYGPRRPLPSRNGAPRLPEWAPAAFLPTRCRDGCPSPISNSRRRPERSARMRALGRD